ncbi:MAG: hypothetical protein QF675_12605, partial [SAR324 cluster bacterium]|nr:hypothetical protein [SAR324 cluster bacterium]
MVEEQTKIVEELNKEEDTNLKDLASRERRQEESLSNLNDAMKEAADAIEQIAPQPAQALSDLAESDLNSDTDEKLTEARKALQNQNPSKASNAAGKAQSNLAEMLSQTQQIQDEFQSQTVEEMLKEFQRVIQSLLTISQSQELLRRTSKGLRSNSPRLIKTAVEQDGIRRQTNKLLEQLAELSKKTFYITPKISRAMGKARGSMDKSIYQLEQKKVHSALKDQTTAVSGLNEAAFLLLDAMDEMQASGSASGLESYLEQLGEMIQKQQGINMNTMQMGQMAGMAMQEMMKRLQGQQEALQKSLQELMNDNPGEETGGLSKAEQDMEEVIRDFMRNKVEQRTTERQERILSRMLDAHKSLTQ